MMTRAIALLTLCLLPGLVACSDDSSDGATTDAQTLVAVDSADFPSAANCAVPQNPTDPRGTYVAELFDVTGKVNELDSDNSLEHFSVQSSEPVLCGKSIGFAEVAPNRAYYVVVRVYPDLDGDPATPDVCTQENTSVTVTRVEGACTKDLATPTVTLHCFGWAEQLTEDELKALKPGDLPSLDDPPGVALFAIEYRTNVARYCIEATE